MGERIAIPGELARDGFTSARGRQAGLSHGRMRGVDLAAPYHGVRSAEMPTTLIAQCRALATVFKPWHAFSGVTAAELWGLPVPFVPASAGKLEVVSPASKHTLRRAGVRPRSVRDEALDVGEHEGLRVTSPVLTFLMLARDLSAHDLAAVGEALITDAGNYPGRASGGPLATLPELASAVDAYGCAPGIHLLRRTVPRLRMGVESPQETRLRLMLVDAGFPEPETQVDVFEEGVWLGRGDMVFRQQKTLVEYEGAHHFERSRVPLDISRYARFEDHGWAVIRVTKEMMRTNVHLLFARLRRALER